MNVEIELSDVAKEVGLKFVNSLVFLNFSVEAFMKDRGISRNERWSLLCGSLMAEYLRLWRAYGGSDDDALSFVEMSINDTTQSGTESGTGIN